MHNIVNNLTITQAANPQTIQASSVNTGNIDTQGATALAVVVMIGNIVDTLDSSHRIDLKIEHADDDGAGSPGTYAACADADVTNFTGLSAGIFKSVVSSPDENKRYAIGYVGGKRFFKVTAVPTSISIGGPVAMLLLKGNLSQKPAVNA
jgi:hypothetical protein